MKKPRAVPVDGMCVARPDRADDKVCTGRDLAKALSETRLPAVEAKAWRRDLHRAHKTLKPPDEKWQ
jgi:hypothetical protein